MNRGPGFESDPGSRPILPHISVPLISCHSLLPYQNKAPPQIAIAVHFQITKYPGTSQYNWMGFYMIPVKSFLLLSMGKLWMCIFLQIEEMAAIETVVDSHWCICFKFTSHVLLAIPKEMRVQSLIAWPNLSLQQCRSGAQAMFYYYWEGHKQVWTCPCFSTVYEECPYQLLTLSLTLTVCRKWGRRTRRWRFWWTSWGISCGISMPC